MNAWIQKNQHLGGNPITTKKVFVFVFFSLLAGATLPGQQSQPNHELTFRGVATLGKHSSIATQVGLEVQPNHPGHNAADVRPAMKSGLALARQSLSVPTPSGQAVVSPDPRSEERRVGKECRS